MKVFLILNGPSESPAYCFLSDSAVTNTGKPFYLPENKGVTRVSMTAAIRIERLGKGIREKFAPRYYSEFAPALHFFLPEYSAQLKDSGLPDDPARNFDKSLFIGEFKPFDSESRMELKLNDSVVASFDFNRLNHSTDRIIEEISVLNTLKMGDIIVPGLSDSVPLKTGDILEVFADGEKAFQVRVK